MVENHIWRCQDQRREEHHFIAASAEEADALYREAFGAALDPNRRWTDLPENLLFIFYPEPTEAPQTVDCGEVRVLVAKYTQGYLTKKHWLMPPLRLLARVIPPKERCPDCDALRPSPDSLQCPACESYFPTKKPPSCR